MSWLRDDGKDGSFVTLAEVIAGHTPEEVEGLVVEHGGTLNEVAAMLASQAQTWVWPNAMFEPFDDVALSATIEGLTDFAAELGSFVLARVDAGQADSSDWAPAVVVLRAVAALSSAIAGLDAARQALRSTE